MKSRKKSLAKQQFKKDVHNSVFQAKQIVDELARKYPDGQKARQEFAALFIKSLIESQIASPELESELELESQSLSLSSQESLESYSVESYSARGRYTEKSNGCFDEDSNYTGGENNPLIPEFTTEEECKNNLVTPRDNGKHDISYHTPSKKELLILPTIGEKSTPSDYADSNSDKWQRTIVGGEQIFLWYGTPYKSVTQAHETSDNEAPAVVHPFNIEDGEAPDVEVALSDNSRPAVIEGSNNAISRTVSVAGFYAVSRASRSGEPTQQANANNEVNCCSLL